MAKKRVGHFIFGLTQSGHKFRPSDWAERIAAVFASFDTSHRLRYDPMVMPVQYEGMPCLFVDSQFATINPAGCQYITEFVLGNHLQIRTTAPMQTPMCQAPARLKDVA
jgi:hypothetical protein